MRPSRALRHAVRTFADFRFEPVLLYDFRP